MAPRLRFAADARCHERGLLCGRVTRIWSSTRRTQRVYIGLEAAGWSRCSGWRSRPRARPVVHVRQGARGVRRSGGACLSSGSLQSSRFTITADAYQAHYQQMPSSSFNGSSVDTQRSPRVDDSRSFILSSEQFSTCPLYNWSHRQHQPVPHQTRSRRFLIIITPTAPRTSLPGIPSC